MEPKPITFDAVFLLWMKTEIEQVEGRDILSVAQSKGFSSITEWRLQTALRLGLDTKKWTLELIDQPNKLLPDIIIGPYPGWSKFFENRLTTTFAEALTITEFFGWCQTHDRVIPLSRQFPLPTTVILLRKQNGELIHIEGGHRICAVAYRKHIGEPIEFAGKPPVTAAIAPVSDEELDKLIQFAEQGTSKR